MQNKWIIIISIVLSLAAIAAAFTVYFRGGAAFVFFNQTTNQTTAGQPSDPDVVTGPSGSGTCYSGDDKAGSQSFDACCAASAADLFCPEGAGLLDPSCAACYSLPR